jgi:hypothetical protein
MFWYNNYNTDIMPKVIQSHIECGYRLGTLCMWWANHAYNTGTTYLIHKNNEDTCKPSGEQNFPVHCPLEDADHYSVTNHCDKCQFVKPNFEG